MYIRNLRLNSFRNYEELDISFNRNINVIFGDNAQGKTNILEAIFLCASGRSHRTSKDAELIKLDKKEYKVKMEYGKQYGSSSIQVRYDKLRKKSIEVNGIPVRKIGELMGNLNAVLFSPEDLLIIKEGPSLRRRFIDIAISQIKPSYFFNLQQYIKILQQRNRLLKEIQYKRSLLHTMDIWNENLAVTGAKIMVERMEFLARLNRIARERHLKLTDGHEEFLMTYRPSFHIEKENEYESIKGMFLKRLEQSLDKEIQKASTLYGPQRDDIELYINDINLKLYGSQGQQRSAVLSLKLSEIDIMREDTEESPVLLLDDVMSELDNNRQNYLIRSIQDIQAFITSTDREIPLGNFKNEAGYYRVVGGKVTIQ